MQLRIKYKYKYKYISIYHIVKINQTVLVYFSACIKNENLETSLSILLSFRSKIGKWRKAPNYKSSYILDLAAMCSF